MGAKAEQSHVTYPKGSIEWILMVDHGVMRSHVRGSMTGAGSFQGGLPLRPPVPRAHVPTESELYNKGLMRRTQLCSKIAAKYKATSAIIFISVSRCHPSPWLVVKQSDITARRDEQRRITVWLECVISCLVAVHGYLARLHGVSIELLRRSSFGFLEPNVVAMSDSNRISPGLLPTKRKRK